MRTSLLHGRTGLAAVCTVVACAAAVSAGATAQAATAQASTSLKTTVMQQQLPSVQALVASDPARYAGFWVDQTGRIAHVEATDSTVVPTTVASSLPAMAGIKAMSTTPATTAAFKIEIDPVKYSGTKLAAIQAEVPSNAAFKAALVKAGANWSEVGLNPVRNQVEIDVTKITPALTAAAKAQFGAAAYLAVEAVPAEAIAQVPAKQVSAFLARTARPQHAHVVSPQNRGTTGGSDYAPWYGGDLTAYEYNSKYYFCTLGYEFEDYSMSTAGHCGSTSQGFFQWTDGAYQGQTFSTQFGNNRIDLKKLDNSTYSPYVWNSATNSIPVNGYEAAYVFQTVCVDGAITGQKCGEVTKVNVTINDTTNQGTATTNFQDQINGSSTLCQGGDSGGPAYDQTYAGGGEARAVGTITAEDPNVCFINDMNQITYIFHDGPKAA
ncbi:MAG: S1 family peptidase [Mycobacterium sp.]